MTRPTGVSAGDRLETLEKTFTRPQLFRFSAIRWNPHRIHYDPEYATEEEGHPDVLVHGPLHEAAIQQLLMDWVGADGELVELACRTVGRAVPEEPYLVEAEVTAVEDGGDRIEFDVWTHQAGERCAEGRAAVALH
jgi:hydroxyacyl-ACP dehydratase HTD2-like protein with hotdog domain